MIVDMMIASFTNEHHFLSNFHMGDTPIFGTDTVEHWFQGMKALDPTERDWVMSSPTPGEAKRRGRKIQLRPDWDAIKDAVMRMALIEKFAPGTKEALLLMETLDASLVEGNTWHDNYWGICTCGGPSCFTSINDVGGANVNRLGALLTGRRYELSCL